MFGWFAPQCPVPPPAKAWVEERLLWLVDQFGPEPFTRRAVILPTVEFFPTVASNPQSQTEIEAFYRAIFEQVCAYMEVDPQRVNLEWVKQKRFDGYFVNDKGKLVTHDFAGLYVSEPGRPTVTIEIDGIDNLPYVIGTMAHELAHERLLGEERFAGDTFDDELLTDLTATFFGFGIFLGNIPRAWESGFTVWPGTNTPCPRYMSFPLYGYSLAHAAWWRGEQKPDWLAHLSIDLKACVKQGLQYLFKTGDSAFRPPTKM